MLTEIFLKILLISFVVTISSKKKAITRERTQGNRMLPKKINNDITKNSRDVSTSQLIGQGRWSNDGISTFSNPKTKTANTTTSITIEAKIALNTIGLSGFWKISLVDLKKTLSISPIQPSCLL